MQNQLRILVIGGYGEFGGRLCELLLRDKHEVIVAGRSIEKAKKFCHRIGGTPYQLNINSDLEKVSLLDIDVLVDAAGPFQSYNPQSDPYKVVITALNCDAHYLDLSDDGEFSKNITALNDLAKEHDRFALSGASSTPALSGAAVTTLQTSYSQLEKIETTILPGIRAPKGYSVMWAILPFNFGDQTTGLIVSVGQNLLKRALIKILKEKLTSYMRLMLYCFQTIFMLPASYFVLD